MPSLTVETSLDEIIIQCLQCAHCPCEAWFFFTNQGSMKMEMDGGRGGYRILVVDDHPDTVEVVCTLFFALGHDAYGATGGLEALEMVEAVDPLIVLVDLSMPGGIGGIEVAERLRAKHGARHYLVALTGWGGEEDRRAATLAGFDLYVVKPADGLVLREVIIGYSLHAARPRRTARSRALVPQPEAT